MGSFFVDFSIPFFFSFPFFLFSNMDNAESDSGAASGTQLTYSTISSQISSSSYFWEIVIYSW